MALVGEFCDPMQDGGLIVANAFGPADTSGRVEKECGTICGCRFGRLIRESFERANDVQPRNVDEKAVWITIHAIDNDELQAGLASDERDAFWRLTRIDGDNGSANPQTGQSGYGKKCRVLEQDTNRLAGRNARFDTPGQRDGCPLHFGVSETDDAVIDSSLRRIASGNRIEAFADRTGQTHAERLLREFQRPDAR